MFKNLKPAFLFLSTVLFYSALFGQNKKDTIYFDEDWSICEKPVAAYYRVCELNRDSLIYTGDVIDYFIDGSIEMTGRYSDSGRENGGFIFYRKNGTIIKKGSYKNGEVYGNWFYYNSSGNVRAVFNCNGTNDFTPLEIINESGDTLLKNGNGKFSFDTHEDLPKIFPAWQAYKVDGEVVDSLKNGTYNYHIKNSKGSFSETYKKGKFIRGKSGVGLPINTTLKLLSIEDSTLIKLDKFYYSNPIFGFDSNSNRKLIIFLLTGQSPLIDAEAENFYDNDKVLFYVITTVLRSAVAKNNFTPLVSFPPSDGFDIYYHFFTKKDNDEIIRQIKGDISLTVDTAGQLINSAFNTTLTKTEINKINYYLERIVDMSSYQNNNEKSIANINLTLSTIIDTLENDKLNVMYVIYNSDSTDNSIFSTSNNRVQVEAKFPGGQDTWNKYLQRNLNSVVPIEHYAPKGIYTVTVSFMVDQYGNISDVIAENDPGYGTAEEAVRVIKRGPKWTPAIKDGKNVAYRQKQTISFQVVN